MQAISPYLTTWKPSKSQISRVFIYIFIHTTMATLEIIQASTMALIEVRHQIAQTTEYLDALKAKRDTLQDSVIETMKESNLKSWKTNDNSFTLVSKTDTRIVDEELAIKDIKNRKFEGLISEKIDTIRFKQIANLLLKEKWELFFGTESITTEYLSIRSA